MEEVDKQCPMIRIGVSGGCFFLVPAYPGSPGQRAVKRLCVCVCVCVVIVMHAIMNSRCDCDGQTPGRFIHALFTL